MPSVIASSSAVSMRATTSSSTACAMPRVSDPRKLLHRAGRNPAWPGARPLRAAAPPAARSISSPSRHDETNFYNMDTTFGTDHTKRVVLDVNQVISPTLAIRAGGLFQDAGVAGRDYIKDDREGGFVATKWTPPDTIKLTRTTFTPISAACRTSACRSTGDGNTARHRGGPASRARTFYGFVNRDLQQHAGLRHGTGEFKVTDSITLTNRTRASTRCWPISARCPNARDDGCQPWTEFTAIRRAATSGR